MADAGSRPNDGGWSDHERAQRRAWLALSCRQRLEWLWKAKQFAARAAKATLSEPPPPRSGRTGR